MVTHTTTNMPGTGTAASEIKKIPTRIQELPQLVVHPETADIRTQVIDGLQDLAGKMAVVHVSAAEAYMSQGMYAEAVDHLEAAAIMQPSSLPILNQLGFARYLIGDDQGAIDNFTSLLGLDPENHDALFNLGMVLFGTEDYASAEDCFRRSLEGNPDDAETWNNHGVALHKMGRADEARASFQRAVEIDPESEDAQHNLRDLR